LSGTIRPTRFWLVFRFEYDEKGAHDETALSELRSAVARSPSRPHRAAVSLRVREDASCHGYGWIGWRHFDDKLKETWEWTRGAPDCDCPR
jgi:hypothetical protein